MKKQYFIKRYLLAIALLMLFFSACTKNDPYNPETEVVTPAMRKTELINDKAIGEWRAGNYPAALEYFTQAYTIAKKNKDTYMIATLLNNMGLVNWRMNRNNEAMECYTESAKIAEQLGEQKLLGLTHTNRCLILKQEKKFDAAFEHNNAAIAIFEKTNDTPNLAIAYNNQGQLYRASEQPDEALHYYFLSLDECKKGNLEQDRATAWQNIADIYREKSNAPKAYDAAYRALAISKKLENKVRISEGYAELVLVHEKFKRPDSALYYFKEHYNAEMAIVDASQSEKLSQNQAKLGMEVKNLRIENLQKEKEIAKNRLWAIMLGAAVLLVIIAFFVYRYFSRMQFKKQQLELELQNTQQIIDIKEQELKTYIIDLSRKNAIISSLQEEDIPKDDIPADPTEEEIAILLEQKILTDDDWENFKARFKAIYPGFFVQIQKSGIPLTEAENRLLVLMHLDLNSKDMANILGISPQSVRVCKMRLKKRLPADKYASVEDFLAELTK
jgi:tetratricopeptide (TPR) repeat protein/DNA-binding CsgD family transcriptional regulator